jgi:IS5 family transposase
MLRFAEIELISDRIPDGTTILTFRHLLEENKLREQIHCFAGLRLRDGEKPSQGARDCHEAGRDH